ncbi:hypothetical protein HAHE_41880 [Haloferula helveola]|uniref:Uncharacterized protein n=1 Tax=Haloferula helveola TaxID=490095 RepID=A0ABN6H9I8_9BACT|nr:hypothetical protein HAHE_41880 [Haloferula helveola]
MSPLPERRKTPEELAALRESLGISADGPPPGAPGVRREEPAEEEGAADELKAAVFEKAPVPSAEEQQIELARESLPAKQEKPVEEPTPEPEAVEEPPASEAVTERSAKEPTVPLKAPKAVGTHSLRKSRGLVVDQPKQVRHREDGSLPVRRHTDEELTRLRRIEAPANEAPAMYLAKQTAPLPVVLLLYGLALIGVSVGVLDLLWISKSPIMDLPFGWLQEFAAAEWRTRAVFITLAATAGILLLGAAWISLLKKLSMHHAGFLTIIAVLVLVFGTLYFFPELHGA